MSSTFHKTSVNATAKNDYFKTWLQSQPSSLRKSLARSFGPKSAIGDWQRALARLFKLAAVPNGCAHRFRHTFSKRLLMEGVPVERVAVLLGHSSPTITMKHYSQWILERQNS